MNTGQDADSVTGAVHDGVMMMRNGIRRDFRSVLPADLEEWQPGPDLAVLLAGVNRVGLSDHEAVRLMVARDRLASHIQAERAADIAEVARLSSDDTDLLGEFAALEVGRRCG
jgi:hypothetical protein